MAISEERLHLLLPKRLKASVQQRARRMGVTVGEYVRRLLEKELAERRGRRAGVYFPFGETPIRTGRKRGSIDHDRPE